MRKSNKAYEIADSESQAYFLIVAKRSEGISGGSLTRFDTVPACVGHEHFGDDD